MESKTDNIFNNIKQIILNTNKPLLIKNQIECDLISWSLEQWNKVLGNELLQFRCGKNHYTEEPQWEAKCPIKKAKFNDFLQCIDANLDEWWYFDYKYLCQWFTDKTILKSKIDWSALGFSDLSSNDSTMWIGSKGAHTSCHMDTYGCNIVLQIYGRKQWILFPPEQNLKPTRIPFEESSIYSKLNFFSPKIENFKGINNCHKVILNPGEVLVVPNRWWHYVENLETAISINAWLPVPQDDFQRIKESIATILVGKMVENQDILQDIILNPNMAQEMVSCEAALNVLTATKNKIKTGNKHQKTNEKAMRYPCEDLDTEQLLNQWKNISKISVLSEAEFEAFLIGQSERFINLDKQISHSLQEDQNCKQIMDFLKVVTDDEVLDLIAKKIIERC